MRVGRATIQVACGLAAVLSLTPAGDAAADGMSVQSMNMRDVATGEATAGGAIMWRSSDEVWLTVSTSGLEPKTGYTIWWIVFNNPQACTDNECGEGDLGNAAANPAVYYAGGFVTGTDGTGHVDVHTASGPIPVGAEDLLGTGIGLHAGNGFGAEIHFVVRNHGKLVIGSVDAQIGSFAGLCGPDLAGCFDEQFAVFPAVAD